MKHIKFIAEGRRHSIFWLIATVSSLQISKRWKLLSIEQQQQELEAKKKSKAEAREKAKKAAGNEITLDFYLFIFFTPTVPARESNFFF